MNYRKLVFNVTLTTGDVVTQNIVLHYCIMSYHYTSYYFNKFHQKIKKNSCKKDRLDVPQELSN